MIRMKLHLLLAETGLSQKDIANDLDIPKNTVSKYVNNSFNMINKDHLDYLCKYFKCNVEDIIEYINEPFVHPDQMKLDLEDSSNVIQEEAIDYNSNNWLTSQHKATNPMDMIKQFNEQQNKRRNYERLKQYYEQEFQQQTMQENQAKQNLYNKNLFSGVGGFNNDQFKKEIVDNVSDEVFKKIIEYFSTVNTDTNSKDKTLESIIGKINIDKYYKDK